MSITFVWLALMLSRYLQTSLWKKLLRTVSTIYSPIIFIVVKLVEKTYMICSNLQQLNHFWKQTFGAAMGSPHGPTISNTFLYHYEKKLA